MDIDTPSYHISSVLFVVFLVVLAWNLIWTGIALYRAGHDRSVGWFILLFLVHTLGILDIIYIFGVSLRRKPTDIVTRESLEGRGLDVHDRALTEKGK